MKNTPVICKCKNCECGIYTYEDAGVCKECSNNNHLSGAKKKDFSQSEQEKPQQSV